MSQAAAAAATTSQPCHRPGMLGWRDRDWHLDDPRVINAVSGALAGGLTAVVVCPLDVLKTRLQVQRSSSSKYSGITGGLSRIVRDEGVQGLYRGLSPTLFTLLPNWAVYFTAYENLKIFLSKQWGLDGPSTPANMAAAAGAGIATMAVTNPFWVVKTRLQTQNMGLCFVGRPTASVLYTGTFDALYRIAREEGMSGLYSGLGPSLFGVLHVVIQFPLYEILKRRIAEGRGLRGPDELTPAELVAASAMSKMVASTATYPHEVVRSRMHVSGCGAFRGVATTCSALYAENGARAFYRGCATNLVRTTPAAAVTFTSFELIARRLRQWVGEGGGTGGRSSGGG